MGESVQFACLQDNYCNEHFLNCSTDWRGFSKKPNCVPDNISDILGFGRLILYTV